MRISRLERALLDVPVKWAQAGLADGCLRDYKWKCKSLVLQCTSVPEVTSLTLCVPSLVVQWKSAVVPEETRNVESSLDRLVRPNELHNELYELPTNICHSQQTVTTCNSITSNVHGLQIRCSECVSSGWSCTIILRNKFEALLITLILPLPPKSKSQVPFHQPSSTFTPHAHVLHLLPALLEQSKFVWECH
jgi:hypothetical protein